jgi:hypothetical protein
LLGPAPAAAIGVAAALADGLVNSVRPRAMLMNMAIFGFLGLAGGVLFNALGAWFDLEPHDTAYALLVPGAYSSSQARISVSLPSRAQGSRASTRGACSATPGHPRSRSNCSTR